MNERIIRKIDETKKMLLGIERFSKISGFEFSKWGEEIDKVVDDCIELLSDIESEQDE